MGGGFKRVSRSGVVNAQAAIPLFYRQVTGFLHQNHLCRFPESMVKKDASPASNSVGLLVSSSRGDRTEEFEFIKND